jgi:predicted dehydrogenase
VSAICDVDSVRVREVAGKFGICDLVDVCTPPKTHAPLTIEALENGAHVLLEKPMATSLAECDQIIAAT